MRSIAKERETKETTIQLFLNLDGGEVRIASGIGFFDHMLTALAVHAGWGLVLNCEGDTWVDGHHSVEDIGIVLGQALADLVDKTWHPALRARRISRWTKRSAVPWSTSAVGRSSFTTPR